MAKQPLFFHVRDEDGQATFAVQSFDDRNFSVGYAVTHNGDNFCKKTGRKIALERATHILNNTDKNASRTVIMGNDTLPHVVRRNIENIVKRSAELLKSSEEKFFVVTWSDRRAKGALVQLEISKEK